VKYVTRRCVADVHAIMEVGTPHADGDQALVLDNGITVTATHEMTVRIKPQPGDYWVIQDDGYISVLAKRIFQKRYRPEEIPKGV
jgi:hypothetical protein